MDYTENVKKYKVYDLQEIIITDKDVIVIEKKNIINVKKHRRKRILKKDTVLIKDILLNKNLLNLFETIQFIMIF